MAGTVVATLDHSGGLERVKWAWTCSSAGAADDSTTAVYNGVLMRFVTVPGTSSDAPTAAYDVTIKDADGIDLLNGLGADRSATATEQKVLSDGLCVMQSSTLTLGVTNAGDVKKGTVYLYILPIDMRG
jgi:hypothetical protein